MRSWIPAGFVMAAVLLGAAAPLGAQSLADVAKKEEQRRKATKDSGKVFTNKDLKSVPPATAPASGTAQTGDATRSDATKDDSSASKPAADASKDKSTVKDQAYWSERMSHLREQLRRVGVPGMYIFIHSRNSALPATKISAPADSDPF
jgi:hypothetical protein